MSEYYCPHCGADLEEQPGFDPDADYWTCAECGQFLTNPEYEIHESEHFEGVDWFCDECGAFLNIQSGFSDWYSTWTCTKCGHMNIISEDEIYDSEEAFQASWSKSDSDDSDDDDKWFTDADDDDDDDEWFTDDDDDDDNDEWVSEDGDDDDVEFIRFSQDEELQREEQKRQREAQRQAREEERRQKQLWKKEHRRRLLRTITRKKQVVGISSEQCKQMRYEDVVAFLQNQEFYNIIVSINEDLPLEDVSLEGIVEKIVINGEDVFDAATQFPFNAKVNVIYHALKRAFPPRTSKNAKRMDKDDVVWEFNNAGFRNVFSEAIPDLKYGWLVKEGSVEKVSIDGKTDYKKSGRFRIDAKIVISYHTFKEQS